MLVEVSGLTKTFGTVRAVDDLSFTVEPGSVTGFLGPNGAGKSTTLRMLLGLVTPDAGSATIGGRAYATFSAPNDEVGVVLDATGFHPGRSGREHLRVYSTVNGYPRARVDAVLDMVGLAGAAGRRVRGYSLGMRQRLALATALLGDPRVLILDEPANGLDPEGIAWMRRLLREFAGQGGTVLVSSHVLSEVQQLVDQIVIINRGRLVRQGDLSTMDNGPAAVSVRTPQLAEFLAAVDLAGGRSERTGPDSARVTGMDVTWVGRIALAERIELHGLAEERGDLEQVFLDLTRDGLAGVAR
jgi:ABC-2 type transport system ATP-binding protein